MKKVIIGVMAFLAVCTIAVTSVYASERFDFNNAGDKKDIESDGKLSGTIGLKAIHYDKYYNGELAYSLVKHGLFGDSFVGRQQKSTYDSTVSVAYFDNCSNAKYRGTLLLNKKDPTRSLVYGYFSFV